MSSSTTGDKKFLMTLRDDLITKGHSVRADFPLRPQVWKILLGVEQCSAAKYDRYVGKGPSTRSDDIKDEVSWYHKGLGFSSVVQEPACARLLNAFVWHHAETRHLELDVLAFLVRAAVFLYTMPSEAEAFYCLEKFVERWPAFESPRYFRSLKLLGRCLEYLDVDFYAYLQSHGYFARTYKNIASIMSFVATENQLIKLWDLLLSHGFHLNVLVVLSRILPTRDDIMGGKDFKQVLKDLDHDSELEAVICCTLELEQQLPCNLLDELKKSVVDMSEDDID